MSVEFKREGTEYTPPESVRPRMYTWLITVIDLCLFGCGPAVNSALHYVKFFDAISATGLRAIRYAKEIPSLTAIVANEATAQSAQLLGLSKRTLTVTAGCQAYLYSLIVYKKSEADRHQAICRKVRHR